MLERLSARVIAMIVGVVALILIVGFTVRSCDKRRAAAAQSRVERSQAEAASNSAADAIGTVARSGEASRASEDLTRENSNDIMAADGAKDTVKPGVKAAGRKALCKRDAYRKSPECREVLR